MFLTLNHQKVEVYTASRKIVAECNKFSKHLPQMKNFEWFHK